MSAGDGRGRQRSVRVVSIHKDLGVVSRGRRGPSSIDKAQQDFEELSGRQKASTGVEVGATTAVARIPKGPAGVRGSWEVSGVVGSFIVSHGVLASVG